MSPTAIALSRRNALGGAVSTPPVLIAADTYNRANGALNGSACDTGGQVWTAHTDLVISSNQLACTVGNVAETLADIDVGQASQRVLLVLSTFGTNGFGGVRCRITDSNNYYLGVVSAGGTGQIYKRVAGTFTLLATGSGTYVAGDELGLSVVGATQTLYRNGVAVGSAADTALTTGNRAGTRHNSPGTAARFDNFAAWSS